MCLEFGTDLNLNPLLCPGVRGNFQVSANVTFRDIRTPTGAGAAYYGENVLNVEQMEPKPYRAYMVIVNTGIVSIQNQLITTSIGSLTEIQVEDAPWLAPGMRQSLRGLTGEGSLSNLWSAAKKIATKVRPFISPVASVVSEIAKLSNDPRAQAASNVANIVSKVARGNGRVVGGKRVGSHSLSRRM
jgi:hypothetical protein